MYPKSDFRAAAWNLKELWIEKKLKIWRYKFPWFICGLWSDSLGSNRPLKKFIKKNLDIKKIRDSGVSLFLTAVDVETGMATKFTEEYPDLEGAVLASSSFPVMFPTQELEGHTFTDGGVRDIAPLSPAISAGADEIVVVTTANPYTPTAAKKPKNVIKMLSRVIDLMTMEILFNDVQMCKHINDNLDKYPGKRKIDIKLIYPSEPLGDALDFNRKLMERQYRLGMSDAASQFIGEL